MRSALFVVVGLVGCKGEPFRPDAGPLNEAVVDASKPAWFQPKPGDAKNWDIQLAGYNFATTRTMMIVDLFDVVPTAQTLDYGGGVTKQIPVGSQPTAIADLKAKATTVLCHVGTGAVRLDDPDISAFPGYTATPPNRPTAPTGSIGWSTSEETDATERFVDYANADAQKVILKRLELAKTIGCDGVVAFRNDQSAFGSIGTGFTRTEVHDVTWIKALAADGHARMLSVGGRGILPGNIDQVQLDYDFMMAERCGEADDCDTFRPFTAAQRSVFALDFTTNLDGEANTTGILCPRFADDRVDGILKTDALDGTAPMTCP